MEIMKQWGMWNSLGTPGYGGYVFSVVVKWNFDF